MYKTISILLYNKSPQISFMFHSPNFYIIFQMDVILKWENLDNFCVSFVSFSTLHPLLACSLSPAVQYWAIWTIHHFCFENRKTNFLNFIFNQ